MKRIIKSFSILFTSLTIWHPFGLVTPGYINPENVTPWRQADLAITETASIVVPKLMSKPFFVLAAIESRVKFQGLADLSRWPSLRQLDFTPQYWHKQYCLWRNLWGVLYGGVEEQEGGKKTKLVISNVLKKMGLRPRFLRTTESCLLQNLGKGIQEILLKRNKQFPEVEEANEYCL